MHRHPRILTEAPVGRHFCQLHDHPADLTRAVIDYARAGLHDGNAVIIFAQAPRLAAVRASLARGGMDIDRLVSGRQLTLLDAAGLLAEIMVDGRPDADLFRRTVGDMLTDVADARHRHTRVYGEVVNLLWRNGETQAALTLEELWNELAREHRFALFCGYEIPGLDECAYDHPLSDIAHRHSDVLETDADDRLQRALDRASGEILGLPLSSALCYFGQEQQLGEHRLPAARRTILWLRRNIPSALGRVLARARVHYAMS